MTAAPDRSLERYEIVDRIAVGGMAEVFRAKAFGAHGFEKTLSATVDLMVVHSYPVAIDLYRDWLEEPEREREEILCCDWFR